MRHNETARFDDEVVKEFRRLVRNSELGNEFKAALQKIYKAGYDNGFNEAVRQAVQSVRREQTLANQTKETEA